jgi:hypothetical protein
MGITPATLPALLAALQETSLPPVQGRFASLELVEFLPVRPRYRFALTRRL